MKFPVPIIGLALLLAAFSATAQPGGDDLRGERVGWARLKTPSPNWIRHSNGDPTLMDFFRQSTSLNIDPTWYMADVRDLAEMCKYPLLFSQGIAVVADSEGRWNLAEYMRRGGFLLIDACINIGVTPDPDVFLAQQVAFLKSILPEARVVELPPEHPVYRAYFQVSGGRPPHTFHDNIFSQKWDKHGLYGVMIGSRMAGLISMSGLQCAWAGVPQSANHDVACMRMLVNIYIYAMLQAGS
jgi:Domain of unknown function (DUF4159)